MTRGKRGKPETARRRLGAAAEAEARAESSTAGSDATAMRLVDLLARTRHSRRRVPMTRSAMALAWGARTGVRIVVIPMLAALATKSLP